MSFFDNVLKGKKRVPPGACFRISQEGVEKLLDGSKDAKDRVLSALQSRGSCDISEISQTSGLSRGQVESIMPSLLKGGYVSYINASSIEE
jgi:hypothetical protein